MPISDVFVIMPFGEQTVFLEGKETKYDTSHFDDLYDLIREAVSSFDPAVRVERMEKKHGNLVAAIIRRIYAADLVIAVLSGRNPNVFYELGIRHALRRGTIMLVSDRAEYPFDLKGYYSEQYSIHTGKDRKRLRDFIVERLHEYTADVLDDSPVIDILEATEREQWQSINNWEARRAAVVFRGLLATITALSQWIDLWLEEVDKWFDPSEGSIPGHVGSVSVGSLKNFAESFPVIGLPINAFIDASNLVNMYEEIEENLTITFRQPFGRRNREDVGTGETKMLAEVVGSKFLTFAGSVTLFADDVCTALEYVMKERKAYKIPWPESIEGEGKIANIEEFSQIQQRVGARMEAIGRAYPDFENRFSGAPPFA